MRKESLTHKKVKFSETTGDEPYIQELLKFISDKKKIPLSKLQKELKERIKKEKQDLSISKTLGETMLKNVGETAAFKMFDDYIQTEDIEDMIIEDNFTDIIKDYMAAIPGLSPLKNNFDPRERTPEYYIYYPEEDDKYAPEWARGVKTAWTTPNAQIAFNADFLRKLFIFGKIKGVKVSPNKRYGEKYVSNGGEIPDEYVFFEFLLIHELMHFANGDFYFEKALKLNGNIVNWVGDFVTNYTLVKNEYPQLPIGLFNEKINYDHYDSWWEMYDVVETEFKKLQKDNKTDKLKQIMNGNAAVEMPGEGEGFELEIVLNENLETLKKEIYKQNKTRIKEVNKALSKKARSMEERKKEKEEREKRIIDEVEKALQQLQAGSNNGGNNQSDGRPPKIEFKPEYKPSMHWRTVITTLIPPKYIEKETYSRASRRRISTSIGLTQSLGISAIPIGPGKRTIKNPINFCIIWDSSFDTNTLNQIQKKLIEILKNKLNSFILIKVNNTDNKINLFNIDLKSKKIIPLYLDKNKIKTSDLNFELEELFENDFKDVNTTSLQDILNFLKHYKPNVVLLSNSNLLEDTKELIAYRIVGHQKFGIITSNKEEYINFTEIVGDLINLTYVDI